jgi:hypothetical protein
VTQKDCSDGNPCTLDFCNSTGCQHQYLPGPGCTYCLNDVDCVELGKNSMLLTNVNMHFATEK